MRFDFLHHPGGNIDSWLEAARISKKARHTDRVSPSTLVKTPATSQGKDTGISSETPLATRTSQTSSSATAASTPRPGLRKGQADIRNTKRGDKTLAMSAALTDESREEALTGLMGDIFSKGSDSQRAAAWKTYDDFSKAWHRGACSLPLTVPSIYAVASMFRKGGDVSYGNYISIAVDMHEEAGHGMIPALSKARQKAERAVRRGLGPDDQAAAPGPRRLARLPLQWEPLR